MDLGRNNHSTWDGPLMTREYWSAEKGKLMRSYKTFRVKFRVRESTVTAQISGYTVVTKLVVQRPKRQALGFNDRPGTSSVTAGLIGAIRETGDTAVAEKTGIMTNTKDKGLCSWSVHATFPAAAATLLGIEDGSSKKSSSLTLVHSESARIGFTAAFARVQTYVRQSRTIHIEEHPHGKPDEILSTIYQFDMTIISSSFQVRGRSISLPLKPKLEGGGT
ncbi:hypothetical protein SERLA73DRAFT_161319 [Serpula lacrymans var. lacrymans S7.3]|uniref:Uncharacterized protein n=2 Tax=Serpula lacrymans var. lacrymans TaxID=341189 RepID=F8Q3N5_SERL3|nr:uncharacterized protein SERLADRAFT_416371 [Serpula lacrymans var. lacrymans S7.9]EGN97120.1 hypothetical protein SERLA73DRAFT_161319 [Serpula lacrymans var. lacrymans S7.3]EGO22729.1 hypothetical protein SERLADRAFT_416371 [Serpula lacrymans var. lacrymans S7.9]